MDRDRAPTDELTPVAGTAVAEPLLFASGRWLGGRYVLDRRLGHGGMSVVWLAADQRLGRPVAIKVLSDTLTADHDYIGRFAREARVVAGLQHPNLVAVYDYDAGERPYLVMEYVEGGDLAALLDSGDSPPAERLAAELLAAVRHIHGAGVLHRDIKPQNVLVDGYGHARLTDFGIARPRDATSITATGHVIGTETYLAPEVAAGEPASERSDLYALGVLLADAARDGAGAGLWKLIDELRDRDPERRPASAAAALDQLERASARPAGEPTQAFATEPPGPLPFSPTPTGRDARARSQRPLALGALGAVAAVALVVALFGGSDDPSGGGGAGAQANAGSGSHGGGKGNEGGEGGGSPSGGGGAVESAADSSGAASSPGTGGVAAGDGATLNDQGFAMVSEGDYQGAVPVLERAVAALRESGDEATYNYALYNLAQAYLGAGRPAEAIPLLEQRMQFDDGQLDEVQAALDRARAAAGQSPPPEEKPGNGPKPGHGPRGGVPPPFEGEEG